MAGLAILMAAVFGGQNAVAGESQAPAGRDKLSGAWQIVLDAGEPGLRYKSHRRVDVRGKDLTITLVADEDYAPELRLKGEETPEYRLQLNGRRLAGKALNWRRNTDVRVYGIVSEAFDEITLQYDLPFCKGSCTRMVTFRRVY